MTKDKFISQENGNEICRISKGTTITGNLTSSSDIRIDGNFEGTIHTKGKLVIGESSKIKGKVFSRNCDMWGNVEGDIFIEDVINLKTNSILTGSLKAPQIGIEIGTIFNGQCNIITKEEYNKYLEEELKNFKPFEYNIVEKPKLKRYESPEFQGVSEGK